MFTRSLRCALLLTACANHDPVGAPPSTPSNTPAEGDLEAWVGRRLPPATLLSTNGKRVPVLRNEPTLVLFFGPWSMSSTRSYKKLLDVRSTTSEPLTMVLVDLDELEDGGAPYPRERFVVMADPMGAEELAEPWRSAANAYSPNTIFLIGPDGVLKRVFRGGKEHCVPCEDSFEPALRAFLAAH